MSKKYVSKSVAQEIHDKAAPFIKWLAEAEEEESSEDDDEIEVSNLLHILLSLLVALFVSQKFT